jgi:hypothetical protein
MNLASVEPHLTNADEELKTFKCSHCGTQSAFVVRRRARKIGDYPR